MPERYVEAILKYLASDRRRPIKPRQLARQLGVSEEDYGTFREAVKRLHDSGRVVLGAGNALTLPAMAARVVGFYRANPKGFGFVVPEEPNAHGDLFIPRGSEGGAMTGDLVLARSRKRGKRGGRTLYRGEIVKILRRGQNRLVGKLEKTAGTWFVIPDGRATPTPVVVRDVGTAGGKADTKVVVEIVEYPNKPGQLPSGVIVETLGPAGPLEVETRAVIRANGLPEEFPPAALAEAREVVEAFDPDETGRREDLADLTVITIDPPDARDFDDAVSVQPDGDGRVTLGVHITDVSHFVSPGGALDAEARQRGNSVYFPRKVLPMLPGILSNGVCSLQQGRRRLCKSVFITYDGQYRRISLRYAETVVTSAKRLTYEQAQKIIDGKRGGTQAPVADALRIMDELARGIEQRRRDAGMLELDLPEVELVFDEQHRPVDVVPAEGSYAHKIIEMFMVEANEAVAELLDRREVPFLRRVHPPPEQDQSKDLSTFVRASGHKLPRNLSRRDMQQVLEAVKGRPESYAVNLAMLKTFQQAEYSPMRIGHFALASETYCHFTSPIRRYPDLTVHRLLGQYLRGDLPKKPEADVSDLVELGQACTATEQRAESAERELHEVLVLQLLTERVGEVLDGVVTGVANFGIFVQLSKYLIDGLVPIEELGDDWWEVNARYGLVRGASSGRTYRIGDTLQVKITDVDVAGRQLSLVPQARPKSVSKSKRPDRGPKAKGKASGEAKTGGKRKRK